MGECIGDHPHPQRGSGAKAPSSTDLKGEVGPHCPRFPRTLIEGQRVLKFAPTLPLKSCCYNPLSGEIGGKPTTQVTLTHKITLTAYSARNDDSLPWRAL